MVLLTRMHEFTSFTSFLKYLYTDSNKMATQLIAQLYHINFDKQASKASMFSISIKDIIISFITHESTRISIMNACITLYVVHRQSVIRILYELKTKTLSTQAFGLKMLFTLQSFFFFCSFSTYNLCK